MQTGRADTPAKKPAGYQSWHDLLFVHWRVPADYCQRLLPNGLTVDTWQGDAWIGLVAFHMSGVRPHWSAAMPYFGRFPETNVRTYVRCGDNEPGIWFFSLDAARLPAVLIARCGWQLNYQWSRMRVDRQADRVSFTARRWLDPSTRANLTAEIDGEIHHASPATLEEFLVERYVFYNVGRRGRLLQGRVSHVPYPLADARLVTIDESLLAANRLAVSGVPEHVVFSPGVDVEIVGLGPVDSSEPTAR